MKKIWDYFKKFLAVVRRYVSPVFIMLLVASFTLWYIAKLNYNYTTELNVKVRIGNQKFEVPCVVEGKGTTLFGYGFYTPCRANIPLSELNYEVVEVPVVDAEGVVDTLAKEYKARISPLSMQDAISVRFSDLKIISLGDFEDISLPRK